MQQTMQCPSCHMEHTFDEVHLGKMASCKCGEKFKLSIPQVIKKDDFVEIVLKPSKLSYLFSSLGLIIGFLGFITIVLSSGLGMTSGAMIGVGAALAGLFLILLLCIPVYVSYQKERYIIGKTKITREFGTIFSDNSTEVLFKRVAILQAKRPWILNLFFKTGHIVVKAAGSSSAKFRLVHIKNTLDTYGMLQERLRANGFHLEKNKLIQSERPHFLGIFGELGNKAMGMILIPIYVIIAFMSEFESGDFADLQESAGDLGEYAGGNSGIIATLGGGMIFIVILAVVVFFKYMDLRKRRYNIFDDAVEYTEGFLSKHNAVIPMENVSDVENTQSFFSKIFGLHDIKVSCAGSGNDVMFKNMVSGEKMIENLKFLKEAIIPKKVPSQESQEKNSLIGFVDKTEQSLRYNDELQATFQMNKLRSIAPYFILLIPPFTVIAIPIIIGQIVRAAFTDYSLGKSSIEKRFHFLTNKHTSYSVEKITGIIVRENLIDKAFKTCSIRFLSLGSSGDLSFSNIKKTPSLEADILEKVGIYPSQDKKMLRVDFTFMNFLKENIARSFILTLTLIFPLFIVFLYKKLYYSKKYYSNYFFPEGIVSHKGIFIQTREYALERNIKGITGVKYPLSQAGKLVCNVAGEKFVQTQKKGLAGAQGGGMMFSNNIKVPYIANIYALHDSLDERFYGTDLEKQSILDSRQALGNTIILPLILLLVMTIFTAVVNIIAGGAILVVSLLILGLIVWSVRVRYYSLEKNRIRAHSGIIYKKRQTILYKKFNFIELNRGFFNKVFKNGSLSIYTLGSGKKEMTIRDVESYKKMYDMLKTD